MSASQQIVCGHCGQINRLPAERSLKAARCGSCHQPIFSGHPIEVDEQAFDRHVTQRYPRPCRRLGAVVWPVPFDGAHV